MDLLPIIKFTPQIPSDRNCWLVRTMGGDYYYEYISDNFIAIGYNEISLNDINNVIKNNPHNAQQRLAEFVRNKIGNNADSRVNSTYASAQLIKYCTQIKTGDIIIVPDKSYYGIMSIGVVNSSTYEELTIAESQCPFVKRMKIEWIRTDLSKSALNPQLQLMFNSRHIVSNINKYSLYVDNLLNDYYTKQGNTYLVIKVRTHDEISVTDLSFMSDIFTLISDYENGLTNANTVKAKICVQSPGDIILYAQSPHFILLIGLFILLINGGTIKIEKLGLNISMQGIISAIGTYLDKRADRKLKEAVKSKLEKLEIIEPRDIIDMIKETKNERNKY